MDLFEAAAEITRPVSELPDLKVFEYDDVGLGWCIHCFYSLEWDDSRADVWIHRIELNTGQHLVPLALTDIPGVDLKAIEAVIAEQEEVEAHDAALALARDPADDGDWAHDRAKDRDESMEAEWRRLHGVEDRR